MKPRTVRRKHRRWYKTGSGTVNRPALPSPRQYFWARNIIESQSTILILPTKTASLIAALFHCRTNECRPIRFRYFSIAELQDFRTSRLPNSFGVRSVSESHTNRKPASLIIVLLGFRTEQYPTLSSSVLLTAEGAHHRASISIAGRLPYLLRFVSIGERTKLDISAEKPCSVYISSNLPKLPGHLCAIQDRHPRWVELSNNK